jgi:hypothetical protein
LGSALFVEFIDVHAHASVRLVPRDILLWVALLLMPVLVLMLKFHSWAKEEKPQEAATTARERLMNAYTDHIDEAEETGPIVVEETTKNTVRACVPACLRACVPACL